MSKIGVVWMRIQSVNDGEVKSLSSCTPGDVEYHGTTEKRKQPETNYLG